MAYLTQFLLPPPKGVCPPEPWGRCFLGAVAFVALPLAHPVVANLATAAALVRAIRHLALPLG